MSSRHLTRKKAKRLLVLRRSTLWALYISFSLLFIYVSVNLAQLLPNILLKYLSPLLVIIPIIYGIASRGKELGESINRFCIRFIIKRPILLYSISALLIVSSTVSVFRIIREASLYDYKIINSTNSSVTIRILYSDTIETLLMPPHFELIKESEKKIVIIQDIRNAYAPEPISADSINPLLYIIPYDNTP